MNNPALIAVDALREAGASTAHAASIARSLRRLDADGMLSRRRTPEAVARAMALGIVSGAPYDPYAFRSQEDYRALADAAAEKFGLLEEQALEIARRLYECEVDGFIISDDELMQAADSMGGAMLEGRAIVHEFLLT